MLSPSINHPRHFIVIGAGRAMVVQALLALHSFAKVYCLAICRTDTRFLRRSALVDEYAEASFDGSDDNELIERIRRFVRLAPDAVVVPADSQGARAIGRIRHRIGAAVSMPAPNPAMLDCFDDKWRFHLFCAEHGLNTPSSLLMRNKQDLNFAPCTATLGTPFVVKPLGENSSRGAYIISNEEELRRHVLSDSSYRYAPLIAQRHIRGCDVSMNLLAVHGQLKAVSIQRRINPRRDSSKICFFSNDYLEAAADTIARKGRYHGMMNVDARIEEGTDKVYLFDANPRFWRNFSASIWGGLNFLEHALAPHPPSRLQRLVSGSADTSFHPLYRPALWPYVLFDPGHRGRLARAMATDICTLATSTRILAAGGVKGIRHCYRSAMTRLKGDASAKDAMGNAAR